MATYILSHTERYIQWQAYFEPEWRFPEAAHTWRRTSQHHVPRLQSHKPAEYHRYHYTIINIYHSIIVLHRRIIISYCKSIFSQHNKWMVLKLESNTFRFQLTVHKSVIIIIIIIARLTLRGRRPELVSCAPADLCWSSEPPACSVDTGCRGCGDLLGYTMYTHTIILHSHTVLCSSYWREVNDESKSSQLFSLHYLHHKNLSFNLNYVTIPHSFPRDISS